MKNFLYIDEQGTKIAGGSKCLFNFIKKLDRKRFYPIVACPQGDLVAEYKNIDVEIDPIKFPLLRRVSFKIGKFNLFNPLSLFSNLVRLYPVVRKLIVLIKQKNIDLVHTNSFQANIAGFLAAKLTGKPIIWHIRDFVCPKSIFIRIIGKRFVDKIIFVSEAVKESFILKDTDKRNLKVIYDGVDMDLYVYGKADGNFRQKFNIFSYTKLIGIVGRLVEWKGHKYFLEAARKIADQVNDVKFLIIGTKLPESQEDYLSFQIKGLIEKLNLKDKVIFSGFEPDIIQVMNALDILVCPSLAEPFGMVVIEALACGTPVIGTDAGGIKEILEHGGGVLVPPADSEAIAQTAVELLGNTEKMKSLSKNGRCNIEANFNIKQSTVRIVKIYDELLG